MTHNLMVSICDECMADPKAPDSYVFRGGVLIPNPDYQEWKRANAELKASRRAK